MDSKNPAGLQSNEIRFVALLKEKELWILVVLVLLYFHRTLFFGETLFYRDLYQIHFPQKQLLAQLIRSGEIPLWDPYLHGGQPFLANTVNNVIYPSNLLYVFLPLLTAFNADIVLHMIVGAVGTYILARCLSLSPLSSFIAATFFTFCGYTLSLVNHFIRFFASAYIPLILLFWHLYLLGSGERHAQKSSRERRWFLLTIVCGLLQLLTGAAEILMLTFLFVLFWSLFYPYPGLSMKKKVLHWVLLVMLISGLGLIQILPAIEMVMQSSRAEGRGYGSFTTWSLNPKRLPEIIFPGFLGHVDTLANTDYWGRWIEDNRFPYILSIYFGCMALFLTFSALSGKNDIRGMPLRTRKFLIIVFFLTVLLALGRYLPFFTLIYQSVPFMNLFRFPIKFMNAGILPVALLAAYSSESHFVRHSPSRQSVIILWVISLVLVALVIAFSRSPAFSLATLEFFFSDVAKAAKEGVQNSLYHAAIIVVLFTLLSQYRLIKATRWQGWVLATIVLVDLISYGKRLNPTAPADFFQQAPNLVKVVRENIGEGRLFSTGSDKQIVLIAPSNDIVWQYRWNLEMLFYHTARLYGIPVIFHDDFDGQAQRELMDLKMVLERASWTRRIPLLSAAGVTLVLTPDNITGTPLEQIAVIRNHSNIWFYLYKNPKAVRPVRVVHDVLYTTSEREALSTLFDPLFDPGRDVVLQKTKESRVVMQKGCSSSEVTTIRKSMRSAVFEVQNDCDGYLLFPEAFYPGWKVTIDRSPADLVRANLAFSGVYLLRGKHIVEQSYLPLTFVLGCFLTSFFVLVIVVYTKFFL